MNELPESYGIRKLHAEILSESAQKLFEFLSGWMGGPQLFIEQYGHLLRRRHFPFWTGRDERDQWLPCMMLVLDEGVDDDALRHELHDAIARLADHMRNQSEATQLPRLCTA